MKKLLTLLMAVLLVLGIAACSTSTPVEEPEENIKIAISVSTFKNPFFERFSEGAKEKAADLQNMLDCILQPIISAIDSAK